MKKWNKIITNIKERKKNIIKVIKKKKGKIEEIAIEIFKKKKVKRKKSI